MLTIDDYADLVWYYSEQDGALGIRSSLGPMLDRLRDGATGSRATMSDDAITQREIEAATRANRIGSRIARLSERARVVLELQYGDPHRLHDLSVSLLAATEMAMIAWTRSKADRRLSAFQSIRGIVLKMGLRESRSEPCKLQLLAICTEAKEDLYRAHKEYGEAL